MIQCLVLEDEQSAQEILKAYIDKTPFLNCVGIYESGLDVPHDQLQLTDVLFLDIQLPELNGLSFLKTLNNAPLVIVTSAYPSYAIAAFEEAVTDYLVKPFSYERFYKSLTRAQTLLNNRKHEGKNQVLLYADKTIYKTTIEDILFLKAEVDYVNVVATGREVLVLDSLQNWSEKLSQFNFVRTHRSYIVNLDQVEKVSGNQIFIKEKVLPIGRTYKQDFLKALKRTGLF
ncbi:LytTR family two component transcriptional regulator [Aquimarina sp. MAR_2010_214]|uniref:LytR/AlgR family response regulator transcription factor n=1 Tax=Aquimarina sp. MAR_2010_214 TaxID=1250026 RepID=UPI000C7113DD|nr:LytTR family DNA-binding domain-containing protein [Aquimarina sp. MAR_2010_214]PKV51913.1 LytTR family two component transcriptional regulator [Aquimarina sp. MAR_2010_214]